MENLPGLSVVIPKGAAAGADLKRLLKKGASPVFFSFFISFSFRFPEEKMEMKKEKKV